MSTAYELKQTFAPNPSVARGKPVHMGVDKKNEKLVYVAARSVIIRSVKDPLDCDVYTEHAAETTVAKWAPSGYYIASGDSEGKVRIWDTVNKEHILKIELPVLGGPVLDLAWSEDSKRIVAVGEGREVFGAAFLFDSGSSVGTIDGHSKLINSCDFKPSRPYRVATGSLDNQVNFFKGPPFKFDHSVKDHTRFVNCVRFSPDGSRFLSAGSDKQVLLYDGKEGTRSGALSGEKGQAHTAGVYSASWSPDGARIVTASADKTCKVWDAATGDCQATVQFSDKPQTGDQQLGVLWAGDHIVSVSLDGVLSYVDPAAPESGPVRLVHGHNKAIKAVAYDPASDRVFTGAMDGVVAWNMKDGATQKPAGSGHTNEVRRLVVVNGSHLASTAMDDTVRLTPLDSLDFDQGQQAATEGLPADLAAHANGSTITMFVATNKAVQVVRDGAVIHTNAVSWEATAIAVSPDGSQLAVGGSDNKIRLYDVGSDGALSETKVLEKHRGPVTSIAYSPDGTRLASSGKKNNIHVWDRASGDCQIDDWCYHTAPALRVNWSPDGQHVVSGGLDSNVFVWSLADPKRRIQISRAHPLGVNDCCFVNDTTILTTGADCSTRVWSLKYE